MTRPPNPKSAKVRKIKVWAIMDGPRPLEYQWGGPTNVYRLKRQAALECYVLTGKGWKGLTVEPATLLLPAKAKGKA
jgi:hypothetical protein